MSKKKNGEKLFDLIHSMSQREKAYFKKSVKAHRTKPMRDIMYLKLFDKINRMERYDHLMIEKLFDSESYLRNLTRNMRELYELLLHSLRNYNDRKKLKRLRINDLVSDAMLLNERGLQDQALARLLDAEKLATKFEMNIDLFKIIANTRKLVRNKSAKRRIQNLKELHNRGHALLDKIQEELKFIDWYDQILSIFEKGQLTQEVIAKSLQESNIDLEAATFNAKMTYFYLQARYCRSIGDFKGAERHFEKIKHLFSEQSLMKIEYANEYAAIINAHFNTLFLGKNLDKSPNLIAELEQLLHHNKLQNAALTKINIQKYIYNIRLLLSLERGGYKEAIRQLIPKIEKFLYTQKDLLAERWLLVMNLNILKAYFIEALKILGNVTQSTPLFKKAQSKIPEIRALTSSGRVDLHLEARFLQVIMTLEIKAPDQEVEPLIIDARWYLKEMKDDDINKGKMEDKLLRLLSSYEKTVDKQKQRDLLKKILEQFENADKYGEIQLWVRKKLSLL